MTRDLAAARRDVAEKLSGRSFGPAGQRVVIEEGLSGEECSLLVLCDGRDVRALAPAQDFKRVGDADTGANTGGMGAYAPMAHLSSDLVDEVLDRIIAPTVAELAAREIDFRGVLYAGLMLTDQGPKLLEYNVRFGDPEAEVLVPLYGASLFDLLNGVADGRLGEADAQPSGAAVSVVLASPGYPEDAKPGGVIDGLGQDGQLAEAVEGVRVYHAGTRRDAEGRFVTAGGRVLCVTGVAETLAEARRRAYAGASLVTFGGKVQRTDIARAATGER